MLLSFRVTLTRGQYFIDLTNLELVSGGDLVPAVGSEYVCIGSMQVCVTARSLLYAVSAHHGFWLPVHAGPKTCCPYNISAT